MSISTQPNARHASLPRGAPARMSAASTMEVAAPRSGPADEMQRPRATMMDYAFRPQPLGNATAGIPFNNSGPSCMPKPTEPPAQRLLPALATELASQLQARKRASLNSQLSCSSESGPAQHAVATVPVAGPCDLLNQSSKRPRLSPVTSPAARLAQQAAFLEDEFVAMKAGTAVIADKTAWVAAARHTAHQMQEVARSKVLKAFRAALRYMDEATLQASVAVHLQLQPSPNKEEAQAEAEAAEAQCAGPSLQAPQALSCPRRPRTRRCPRPASAALQGLARQPSLGRPVSAPAECPGWDWGRDLPSATSALLQAVEVAAAAEPRPSDALLPSPPSWKRHQRDVQPLPSPTDAIGRQPKATTTAVAAPALLLALAADPQSHVPAFAAGPSSEPAAIRRLTVEDSQSPPLVCRPVVHRQPQRQFSLASPVPPHASPAPQPASRANANPATHAAGFEDSITASSGFEGFPTETAIRRPAELVKLPLADHALVFRPQATAGSLQPRQGERAGSVLQSPFAAMADLPMRHQPGQTATAQPAPSSIVMQGHPDCQLAWSSAHALQHAGPQAVNQGHQVHAHQVLLGPAKPAEQQDRYSAQKLQREKLPPGLDSKAHHTLRLPLSPSSVNVLQPLAKAQAKALPWSSFLQSNSSKMHSLFHAQGLFDFKLGTQPGQPVSQSDLLPGRNVVVANASVTDLAHLLLPPSHWCWVARIDKVLATHMRVSWYGKHNGRWTLARHLAGPDEGQVRTGDIEISNNQILAVFDRFNGNKDVPVESMAGAAAQLASITSASEAQAGDQENRIVACV